MRIDKYIIVTVIILIAGITRLYGHGDHGSSDVSFIENKGQFHENVRFKTELENATFYLEQTGITYDFVDWEPLTRLHANPDPNFKPIDYLNAHALKLDFVGANPQAVMTPSEELESYRNYFVGNDPRKWASQVKLFEEVGYSDIYPHVDLQYYGFEGKVKYDFIVKPNGNPDQIKIHYRGADRMQIIDGELVVETSLGELYEEKPYAYQRIAGIKKEVECEFQLSGDTVMFVFPEGYNENFELIIDPIIIFASYTGSYSSTFGSTATYDNDGNLYAGGFSFGNNYPTSAGAYQVDLAGGQTDIAVSKFDSDGTQLLFSTYIGGSNGNESPHSLVVDHDDNLYILGTTGSSDYPTTAGAVQENFGGGPSVSYQNGYGFVHDNGIDIIVSKLSPDGSNLLASTFVGGSSNDGVVTDFDLVYNYGDVFRGEIIVDENQNCYIASTTNSTDFPTTPGVMQEIYGGGEQDAVVFSLNDDFSVFNFSTFLGGNNSDSGYSLKLGHDDDLFVVGGTNSNDLNMDTHAIRPDYGGQIDGYVMRLSVDGQLINSTYIGSPQYDQTYFVEVDIDGDIYVVGQTESSYPIQAFENNPIYSVSSGRMFIHKMNNGLNTTLLSTRIGSGQTTGPEISPSAFLVNDCGLIYLSGWGGGTNNNSNLSSGSGSSTDGLPVTNNAYQSTTTGNDFYVTVLRENAESIFYASYFGGNVSNEHVDGGTSRFDKKGNIYQTVCAGCGGNSDFPTTPGVVSQMNNTGACDIGVFKFNINEVYAEVNTEVPPYICVPEDITFENNSLGTNFFWDFGDGNTSTEFEPTHTFTEPGEYEVMLVVTDSLTCYLSDTAYVDVLAYEPPEAFIEDPDPICEGLEIELSASGGGEYEWMPADSFPDPTIDSPILTVWEDFEVTLVVHDEFCGTDTTTAIITVNNDSLVIPDTLEMCVGQSIQINASGAEFLTWSPPDYLDDPNAVSPTASPPEDMTYFGEGESINGCELKGSVHIRVDDEMPNAQLIDDTTICRGTGVDLDASGGSYYDWSPATGLSSTVSPNPEARPLETMTYVVEVSNACGVDVDSVTIGVQYVEAEAWGGTLICPGDTIGIAASGGDFYEWSPSSYVVGDNTNPTAIVSPPNSMNFTVTVSDSLGCSSMSSVYIGHYAKPDIDAGDYIFVEYGESVTLNVEGEGTFVWWDEHGTYECYDCMSIYVTPEDDIVYYVTVIDAIGCQSTDSIRIEVGSTLYVPNAFTPDGDGINDIFRARGHNVVEFEMLIFNRWGELIFESGDIDRGWDGTYKGRESQIDTYVWKIKFTDRIGKKREKMGHVTLVR